MNKPMKSRIAASLLALGALLAAAGAQASTSVHVSIGVPAAPVAVPVHQVYEVQPAAPFHAYDGGHRYEREQASCGAPRWNGRTRYMPGDVVWRKGDLFVARRVSARVWNVNSPPEWTPQYWSPAVCR